MSRRQGGYNTMDADWAPVASNHETYSMPSPPARTTTKLRDCCQSCAKSKVKCTKEKPTCSRCDTRGLPCQYVQSRRPGRIPGRSARRLNLSVQIDRETLNTDVNMNYPGSRRRGSMGSEPTARVARTEHHQGMSSRTPHHTTAPTGYSSSDGNRNKTDSLFNSPCGTPDTDFLNNPFSMDSDMNVQFDWEDGYGSLSTIDNSMYSNFMDWDTELTPVDSGSLYGSRDRGGSSFQYPQYSMSPQEQHNPEFIGFADPRWGSGFV